MSSPGGKSRGRPFQPGNPGRPPGSKNKVTRALEQLAEGQAEQVFQKVIEQALAGDVAKPENRSGSRLSAAQRSADQRADPANKWPTGRALLYCRHFQRDRRRPAHTG